MRIGSAYSRPEAASCSEPTVPTATSQSLSSRQPLELTSSTLTSMCRLSTVIRSARLKIVSNVTMGPFLRRSRSVRLARERVQLQPMPNRAVHDDGTTVDHPHPQNCDFLAAHQFQRHLFVDGAGRGAEHREPFARDFLE